MFADVSPGWGVLQSGITALAGFGGVCVGGWLTARNQTSERKHAGILEQLQQFYSPMVGMMEEIAATKNASERLQRIARDALVKSKGNPQSSPFNPDDPDFSSINSLRDYDHKQWWSQVMPLYEQMLNHFTKHMWLAEESTRQQYSELMHYVEIWRRFNSSSLRADVAWELDFSDKCLMPLYEDLQSNFVRLRTLLSK